MQGIIGIIILIVICVISLSRADLETSGNSRTQFSGIFIFHFFVNFVKVYLMLATACFILWVVLELGIFFREIILWLIAAVMYPFSWIF